MQELKERVFVTEPGWHETYLVVGEKTKREELLKDCKNGWKKGERVLYVETELKEEDAKQGSEELFRKLWSTVVTTTKEQLPEHTKAEEDLYLDIIDKYELLENSSSESGLSHDELFSLLSMLTEYKVQVVLVVKEFQNATMDKDREGFFTFLFDISPKVAKYNLAVLLLSEKNAEQVAEPHMFGGSRFSAAYTQIYI